MPTVKFKAKAEFQFDDGVSGYLAIVTFGDEEVYRGKRLHLDKEMAEDEADSWITGAVARLLRLWCSS